MKKVDKGSYVTDRYECELCGHQASYATMLNHQGQTTCLTKQAMSEMKSKGMSVVYNSTVLKAIDKAGIGIEKRPVRNLHFTEDWVMQAVASYRKVGRYAGMTLVEYLKRMKPD